MDKQEAFMDMAIALANLSTCKRRQVGCIIVTSDYYRILAIGYNGRLPGEDHDLCDATQVGGCGCFHAEMNALLKLNDSHHDNLILFTTVSPCLQCARAIEMVRRIKTVVIESNYRDTSGITELKIHDVEIRYQSKKE